MENHRCIYSFKQSTLLSMASCNFMVTLWRACCVLQFSFLQVVLAQVSSQRKRKHRASCWLAGWQGQLFLGHQQDIPKAVLSLLVMTPHCSVSKQLSVARLSPGWDVQGHARRRPAPMWAGGPCEETPECSRSSQREGEEMTKKEEGRRLFRYRWERGWVYVNMAGKANC